MADTTFTIHTKSNGTYELPYATSDPNNWTVGEPATFTFEFPDFNGELVVSDSYTAGTEEYYDTVTVESGATLTIPSGSVIFANSADIQGTLTGGGTLSLANDFAAAFTNFAEWAGSWTTLEMLSSELKYRIQIPGDAGIDSLVWGIEPNQTLQGRGLVGVWGLVESISNERNKALTTNRYTVEVTVLAPIDEYATIGDVETDLVV